MDLVVNGAPLRFDGATIAALVEALGYDLRRVAIERNLQIIPKSRLAKTPLADGDRIEIVHFIGGG